MASFFEQGFSEGEDEIPRRVPSLSDITLADIPPRLGLFPLPGALLLPGGRLPLNVFEPRYIALLEDALADRRLIGIIQPDSLAEDMDDLDEPDLHTIGTIGRITSFTERSDGTFSISLFGVCRFRLLRESGTDRGWRQGIVDASSFSADLVESEPSPLNRGELMEALRRYFAARRLRTNWPTIEEMDDDTLLLVLPMLVPFSPNEKQALLEAETLNDRAEVLLDLLARGME
ncbi:LON peptidase substrate-binding domain-containing protein [Gluconobacter wancherniae]|uniref:LON peptidase substrate-binding domain-containing protein n=1 Tax=Gluconobacter wancherniae TaxID=1307955 RepID=UPI001B8CFF61|nr:LON peptidase substrate-binding domain-containing protein [Gluconobacter wancherniae]MBS1064010.1 LON peptidase substrate-binding domain-containing protein [Gluconobacter wancherniae]